MADSITSGGIYFPAPYALGLINQGSSGAFYSTHTITVSNAVAFMGRIYLDGRPASKILSSAGGSVSFRTGGVSVWTALSVLSMSIQGVDTAVGPPARPNGVIGASRTITSSTVALPGSTWQTFTMASGTSTLSHGQMYAFVMRMITRVSTDAASLAGIWSSGASSGTALVGTLSAGTSWTTAQATPNILFNCDDGTLGWFIGAHAVSNLTNQSISAAGTNTEYGMRFTMPWTCEIDALAVYCQVSISSADFSAILYSDPNGTPTTITAISVLANEFPITAFHAFKHLPLSVARTLSASTTYLLAIKPVASCITFQNLVFADAAHKVTVPGGGSLATGARAGGSGAFSLVETSIPHGFHVRVHKITPTTTTITATTTTTITVTVGGGAGGMLVHPGMTGGLRG